MRALTKVALGATVLAVGITATVIVSQPRSTPLSVEPVTTPSVRLGSINGVPIKPGKLTVSEGVVVAPDVITSDGSIPVGAVERSLTYANVLNTRALRQWVLCGPELRAQAARMHAAADAIYAFPQNKPLNESRSTGSVTATDAREAKLTRLRAQRYIVAARLAERAEIPCVKPGAALDDGNYTRLVGTNQDGRRITLQVPDYSVASSLLVEYLAFMGDCERKLTERQERAKNRAVDTAPNARSVQNTFTERDKVTGVAWYTIATQMARESGMNVSCK